MLKVKSDSVSRHSVVFNSVIQWTTASQAPLSMEFSKNTGVCCHSYVNYILCFFYKLACYVSVSIKITFVVQSLSCV